MKAHLKILSVLCALIAFFCLVLEMEIERFSIASINALFKSNYRKPTSESGLKNIKLPYGITADIVPYVKFWGEYLEATGITSGQISHSANTSLIEFNRKRFGKNSCFARLAGHFYDEIQREDLKFYAKNNFENKKLRAKASIADSAGHGAYSSIKPGWLWEAALKYAQGDKNLAFQLIGVCGHDDSVPDANVHFPELSPEAEKRRNKYLKFYRTCDSGNNSCSRALMPYQMRLCPTPTSRMFLPKSLGYDVDIDQALKNRIGTIQAPTMGAAVIPAKHYHVLGSAFTACLAIERCPDGVICPKVFSYGQRLGINIYRGVGICDDVNGLGSEFIDKPPKDFQILFKKKFPNGSEVCESMVDTPKIEDMIAKVSRRDCLQEWDKTRCEAALLKLQTLKVDFEWSRASHQVGYEFAYKNCPRIGSTKDPLEKSCEALQKVESKPNLENDEIGTVPIQEKTNSTK